MMRIVRALPEWFALSSHDEIEEDLVEQEGFVASAGKRGVGFLTFGPPEVEGPDRIEISWMAVARAWHGRGIGHRLVDALAEHLGKTSGPAAEISVWTLADSSWYEPYDQTRRFYRGVGFKDWYVDKRQLTVGGGERLFLWRTADGSGEPPLPPVAAGISPSRVRGH